MNRERKKSLLRSYNDVPIDIQALMDQYEEIYTSATHITANYGNESGGSSHNNESKIEKRAIKLAELSVKIRKYKAKQGRIDKAVAKLKPYYQFLIREIDIKQKGVSRVAHETHRDVSSLAKTHNKALDALEL